MKKLVYLVLIGIFASCSEDEDIVTIHDLNGDWNLISVSCFCVPLNLDVGDHVWTFKPSGNKLAVAHNLTDKPHTLMASGEYDITINSETKIVTVQSVEYDYFFENSDLILSDHPEVDGPMLRFVRGVNN